jgi:hypothetical protein
LRGGEIRKLLREFASKAIALKVRMLSQLPLFKRASPFDKRRTPLISIKFDATDFSRFCRPMPPSALQNRRD